MTTRKLSIPINASLLVRAFILVSLLMGILNAQTTLRPQGPQDPGVRAGKPGAGNPLDGLNTAELDFFKNVGTPVFNEVETVDEGFGPRFNLDSCGGCHAHPAIGGSSPPINPQVAHAATMAPGNTVPSFLTLRGPIREVRFVKNPDGTPDGGVHAIFTISGRADKPRGCNMPQPNFTNASNMVFRIPTPVFGAGLIEEIMDSTLEQNLALDLLGMKRANGISGRLNRSGNDGTVSRFGWKAQNKSLMVFAGEAYQVEQGVTNEMFPNERDDDADCAKNGTPESDSTFQVGLTTPSDVVAFRGFMRFLDAPAPACQFNGCPDTVQSGHINAMRIGCMACHTEVLITGRSATTALNRKPVQLFSDLAIHHMGAGLADGVTQGLAGPDEFRTAPLWGLGQRVFFLHDGRTGDLLQTILAHDSPGSEASKVVAAFKNLTQSQQQDILNFLRSL